MLHRYHSGLRALALLLLLLWQPLLKCLMGISHAKQLKLLCNNILLAPPQYRRHWGLSCWFPCVLILLRVLPPHGHFACKEIQIPYLRLARHEHLNSTGQKHFAVRLTKRTVICGIDLIIYILLSMKILTMPPRDTIKSISERISSSGSRPFKSRRGIPSWQPSILTVEILSSTTSRAHFAR